MLTTKLKVKNQPDPESRYAPKELRAIDRLVEKEKAEAKKMRLGKQFLAYANKITLVPKAALDQVALSPRGEDQKRLLRTYLKKPGRPQENLENG